MTLTDLLTLLPLVFLAGWAVLLLLLDLWIPVNQKGITAVLSGLGLVVTIGLVIWRNGPVMMTAFNDS